MAEETVSKYTVFATKFLRCAIETLKKVKAKGNHLDEVTKSLNLGKYQSAINKWSFFNNTRTLKFKTHLTITFLLSIIIIMMTTNGPRKKK